MAELIGCRSCDSPNCKGCNVYTLDEALNKNHFNLLMDEHHSIHIKADVVEVVRCKDCKHRDPEDKKCDCGGFEHAHLFPVPDDWFCADGKRK